MRKIEVLCALALGACCCPSPRGDDEPSTVEAEAAPADAYVAASRWLARSPSDIEAQYLENEFAAEKRFEHARFLIIGVADEITRDTIGQPMILLRLAPNAKRKLSLIEPRLVCRLTHDAVGEAANVRPGQLVMVEGKGLGRMPRGPEFSECSIRWRQTAADPAMTADPLVLARSTEICLSDRLSPMMKPEQRKTVADLRERSAGELARKKLAPIPCWHPLMSAVFNCEDASRPECQVAQVRAARRLMLQ